MDDCIDLMNFGNPAIHNDLHGTTWEKGFDDCINSSRDSIAGECATTTYAKPCQKPLRYLCQLLWCQS